MVDENLAFAPASELAGLIANKHVSEETIIAASAAFEQARPWIRHRPAVS